MKRIVLAGGNGYLGQALQKYFLAREWEVIVLARQPRHIQGKAHFISWDGETVTGWEQQLDGAFAVVNLAGFPIYSRYTPKNKKKIIESRVNSTRAIGRAISRNHTPPQVWLNASGSAHYPESNGEAYDETSVTDNDTFAAEVCRVWESTFFEFNFEATRQVALRTTMVVGPSPNLALDPLIDLSRKGLGGAVAGGKHWMSWIHQDDLCRAVEFIIDHSEIVGPVNLAAPEALKNADFMAQLREAVGVKFGLPVLRPMLEVGALAMGTSTELILSSRHVFPQKLLDESFAFNYPTWKSALEAVLKNSA